ncbi:C1 family peptidase, partial [bacterium]|nr:C1 family peptidase [candidate division CSSED10-310 bacterium]
MRRSWNPLWSLPVILAILLLSAAAANARDPWDQTAHDAELARIRAEIEANGYDWIAEETSVSVLSPEERAALLGLVVPDGFKPPIPPENERLINDRTVYDWRNMGGTTGVRSQGNCGSCWAFGLVATLESQIKINDGLELDLSEQQMVSCNTYGYGCDGGWLDAANHMVNPGMVDEWCMPYQASDTVPCTQGSCPNFYQIDDWWYSGDTVTAIKNALQDGPVTTTMTVYDDFYSYSSGCYQHTGSTSVNHCIQIVGWDDSQCSGQGAWIIKNSWGAGWGMSGFAYMKYGTANVGYSTVDTSYTPTNPVTIAYADHEMDDSAGDNDGILDPGETITIMVDLTNLGTATGTFVSATLSCTHLLVTMNDGQADFPDIPAGATRTSLAPHFTATVSSSVAVGTRLTFTLAITAAEGTFSGTFSMPVGELAEVYFSDFESGDAGWTHYQVATQDDWQRGAPQGTSTTDPGAAFSGSGIWGNDLGESGWDGNYKNNINNYLQSPVIDCTGATQTRLSYMRWLAVESGQYDQARIKVNNTVVWENDYSQDHIDTQWTLHEVDISAIADDTPSVQVVFELVSDAGVTFGGWNIDDFAILAIPDVPNPTATPTVPPTATRTPTSAPP